MTKNIWYLHPYAGGPGFGNSIRAFQLASGWNSIGYNSIIYCSSWHHLMGNDHGFVGDHNFNNVNYAFVDTRKYKGNGYDRLMNMLDYCLNFFLKIDNYVAKFGEPNFIIISSPHPYAILCAKYIANKYNAKLIFEVRDLWPLSLIELANVKNWHPIVFITAFIEKYAYRKIDACVSLLPNSKKYMVSKGLHQDKFHYIPNGAIVNKGSADNITDDCEVLIFTRQLIEKGNFVLIYTGAMGPPNNLQLLVEAAKYLKDMNINWVHIILMGDGIEKHYLQKISKEYELDNVRFFNHSNRSVVNQLMNTASAGFASLKRSPIFYHGVSVNKLYEYMQCNLPIIFAADVPINPVELSGCGYITSPDEPKLVADTILKLSTHSDTELKIMGKRGFNYVLENHDYKVLSKKYIKLFEKLIK